MILIKHLLEMADDAILLNGFDEISRRLQEMREISRTTLKEGFTDDHRGDLEKKFDELERKLIAARRALGTVNAGNLSPYAQREHKSRVMRHINFFRKQMHDVMLELGMSEREIEYHLNRISLDREHGKPAERFTKEPKTPEDRTFSNAMNKERNFAAPDDVANVVKPNKGSPRYKKWYQRMFRNN